MQKDEMVIIELRRKQQPILVDTKTRKMIPAENLTSVKLVDDIVEEIEVVEGTKKVKRKVKQCICVEDGEREVYLSKHTDPKRKKSTIKRIDRRFGFIRIDPNEDPAVLDFFRKALAGDGRFASQYVIVDPAQKAKDFAKEDRDLIKAKAITYSEDAKIIDKIRKYAVISGLIDRESAESNEAEAIGALVSMTITPQNAPKFLEIINSDRLERQFEMLDAIKHDIIRIDNFKSEINYTDSGRKICSFPAGMMPAVALADFTMKPEGESTYQFIHEQLVSGQNIEMKGSDAKLDDLSLLELVQTGIRVEAISNGATGFRFSNVAIGGTEEKAEAHFEKHPDKVALLKTAIEERLQ